MGGRIVVINPNSSVAVTADIDAALEPLRFDGGPVIDCLTLAEGPPGIETQCHVDRVVAPLIRLAAQHDDRASAFVVACFSDPGVQALRETTSRPVFGIAESGLLSALALGDQVGIIAILAASAARHARFFRGLGIQGRIAGELPLGLRVGALADEEVTRARMTEVGARLRDENGADVLVMGCAGMARYREGLEDALALPVVDPTQAAVAMAIAALRLGWRRTAQRDGRA